MEQIDLSLDHDFHVEVVQTHRFVVRAATADAARILVEKELTTKKGEFRLVSVLRVDLAADALKEVTPPEDPTPPRGPRPTTRGGTPGAGRPFKVEFTDVRKIA